MKYYGIVIVVNNNSSKKIFEKKKKNLFGRSYVDKMVKPDWSNFPRHIERDLDNGLLLQQFVLGTCMTMRFLD